MSEAVVRHPKAEWENYVQEHKDEFIRRILERCPTGQVNTNPFGDENNVKRGIVERPYRFHTVDLPVHTHTDNTPEYAFNRLCNFGVEYMRKDLGRRNIWITDVRGGIEEPIFVWQLYRWEDGHPLIDKTDAQEETAKIKTFEGMPLVRFTIKFSGWLWDEE